MEGSEPTAKTRCCLKRKADGPLEASTPPPPRSPALRRTMGGMLARPHANHHHPPHHHHHEGEVRFQMAPNGNMMLVFEQLLGAITGTPAGADMD
jgi:hypothetical protein